MRFRVLGPLEVEGDAGPVVVSGGRPRALLTALLQQPGAVVTVDRLADAVWGEQQPEAPANALQQVVARLRGRLAAGAPRGTEVIVTAPGGYRLDVPPEAVDAEEFERGYRRARDLLDTDPRAAAEVLDAVLPLWRGTAYGEFAESFARAPSVRLEELRTAAREDRVALHLRLGELTEAVAGARDLVSQHPLRDRPVEVLMRALHASGRVPEALAVYRQHRELLADELGLDPPARLRDLEGRMLREDLPSPVEARPDAARAAARTPEPRPAGASLPSRPGPLIGREQDLELLDECVRGERVVTLVGPGGVGKTRLALEACHRAALAGRRVWWADLSTVTHERLVDAIAETTGVEMPRGDDPAGALAASLQRVDGVLCLDNAETVLTEAAATVEVLTGVAPQLTALVTSRERLDLGDEHVHLLAPLPLPSAVDPGPAVELFLARAATVGAAPPTGSDLVDVVELCRRLDGLPLAIELAAARAPAFGIREFADQVGAELDLLAGGRRASASRHQTLRAVVDASYRLLTPDEALLFERLAVFPGRFRLAEVRSVCADDRLPATSVGALLARLVEQSLVQAGGGGFRLLDTLRTYAAERLSDEDQQALRARHARHVARRVVELRWIDRPEREAECVAALSDLTADLHLAWDHAVREDRGLAVELAATIYDYAYPRQRRDLMEWGRQVAHWDVAHPLLPLAWATAVAAAWGAGDFAEAADIAARAETSEDGSAVWSRVVGQWGNLAMFAGQTELAIARFRRSAELNRSGGQVVAALMTEACVCQAMAYGGRADEALRLLPELRTRAARTGNPSAVAWVHYVTGEATGEADVPAALEAYRRAEEAARQVDHRLFRNLARSGAVALAARWGSAADVLSELDALMDDWDEIGNVAAQWWTIRHVALFLERLGHDADAARLYGAVEANSDRSFFLMGEEERLAGSYERIHERQGGHFLTEAFATGGRLSLDEAMSAARDALGRARDAVRSEPDEKSPLTR